MASSPDTHIIKIIRRPFHKETISTLFSYSAHHLRSSADSQLSSQARVMPRDHWLVVVVPITIMIVSPCKIQTHVMITVYILNTRILIVGCNKIFPLNVKSLPLFKKYIFTIFNYKNSLTPLSFPPPRSQPPNQRR